MTKTVHEQRVQQQAYERTAILFGNLFFNSAPFWYAVMNLSAVPLSSHCSNDPMLASIVSPPMTCSMNKTGSSTTISNAFSGTLAIFLTLSNDIVARLT